MNITLNEGYKQVCVWPGTIVGKTQVADFEKSMVEMFNLKYPPQYLEEVLTYPTEDGEGGRNDLFFTIHSEDITRFAVPRLSYGIRWIEDVYLNGGANLYPSRISKYISWTGIEEYTRLED